METKLLNNSKFKVKFELHKKSLEAGIKSINLGLTSEDKQLMIDELNLMRDFEMGLIEDHTFFDEMILIHGD